MSQCRTWWQQQQADRASLQAAEADAAAAQAELVRCVSHLFSTKFRSPRQMHV